MVARKRRRQMAPRERPDGWRTIHGAQQARLDTVDDQRRSHSAEPDRLFEFLVHLVWPLTDLVTWGYRFEPQSGSTLVTQYRQDHRPTWWAWVGSKQLLRISDSDAHYIAGMEATLDSLANGVRA
jgi:N6-adenosine-specific RNA methylase IME4